MFEWLLKYVFKGDFVIVGTNGGENVMVFVCLEKISGIWNFESFD